MAFTLYTQSVEGAIITITNGGTDSDAKKLKWRDLRVYGLNVSAGSSTVTVHMDFVNDLSVDYVLLGNLTFNASNDEISFQYSDNNTDWTEFDSLSGNYANDNVLIYAVSPQEHRYWRLVFPRATDSSALTLSCIFIGEYYELPVNYQYPSGRSIGRLNEIEYDIYGYPYGHGISSVNKYQWDIKFNLNSTQLTNLTNALHYCEFNLKPFFIKDTNINSDYHLVIAENNPLTINQLSYDFYEVNLVLREL